MQSLLQTRPENLDDLTVQVALVRPGPIQGKAVHPYIEHRQRLREDPTFEPPVEHESLREALRDTLGVVVFQDQVLDVAMAAARLLDRRGRRAAPRDEPQAQRGGDRGVPAALRRGLPRQRHRRGDGARDLRQARRLLRASGSRSRTPRRSALLAYQSAWLRRYYPAEFLCALLNAQPMGFYPPSSLVRDAQRRGVEVRPPHVNRSAARVHDRGRRGAGRPRLRPARSARRTRRRSTQQQPYADVGDLARRASVEAGRARGARRRRARATSGGRGASCSGGSASPRAARRSPAATASSRCRSSRPPRSPSCRAQTPWEQMLADYKHTSLSVGVHPLQLLRPHLPARSRDERRAAGDAERLADRGRRDGDRAPAAVDRERRSSSCCSRTSTARRT